MELEASEGYTTLIKNLRYQLTSWRGAGRRDDDETLLVVSREGGTRKKTGGSATPAEFKEVMADLARVKAEGDHLLLHSSLNVLPRLKDWLASSPRLMSLEEGEFEVLSAALYEACSNIIEHGFGGAQNKEFHIWRVPETVSDVVSWRFVILDEGTPFSPDQWEATDFSELSTRRRGHGFGLDIIHRAMVAVSYRPGTPEGNITTLVFDPGRIGQERKVKHA
jgi:anti-sigma regulatory factor (Ser/Thr protein kinase)